MVKGILDGIRVLDLTIYQLGPVQGVMLAQMGAEVIHIEAPIGGPGRLTPAWVKGGVGKGFGGMHISAYFEECERGKKSLVLDLKRPKARQVLYELVAKSDVFIQNMRTGVADKLGCDYETLKKYNPTLIYSSGTAFGAKGPDAAKPGFDYSGAARSGALFCVPTENGEPAHPMSGSFDQIGAIAGAFGVVSAILARERYGIGQKMETSHLAASMWLMMLPIQRMHYLKEPQPLLPRSQAPNPLWNHYRCKDGEWLALCMLAVERHWPAVCQAMDVPESIWKDNPHFNTRAARRENSEEVVAYFEKIFIQKTRDEWIKIFTGKDIMWERVQKIEDLEHDPQVIANDYMTDYTNPLTGETYKHLALPFLFSETPVIDRGRAPLLGEHTEEVLVNILGYKKEEVPALIEELGRPEALPQPEG
jgi:crotonobetainyl-CoA:carnitine CoA-transferase CaiB-like acyl-CoA transferase